MLNSNFGGHASWQGRTLCCWPGCDAAHGETTPLCRPHMVKVWHIVGNEARTILEWARDKEPQPRPYADGQGYVYFIRFRDRIKIGWTGNVKQRLSDLPHDEVLAVIPGTMTHEKQCHAAFAHLRYSGEWFRPGPDLLAFIEDVRQQHG